MRRLIVTRGSIFGTGGLGGREARGCKESAKPRRRCCATMASIKCLYMMLLRDSIDTFFRQDQISKSRSLDTNASPNCLTIVKNMWNCSGMVLKITKMLLVSDLSLSSSFEFWPRAKVSRSILMHSLAASYCLRPSDRARAWGSWTTTTRTSPSTSSASSTSSSILDKRKCVVFDALSHFYHYHKS